MLFRFRRAAFTAPRLSRKRHGTKNAALPHQQTVSGPFPASIAKMQSTSVGGLEKCATA